MGCFSVTNMGGMFDGARDYDQDMTKWCGSQFSSEPSGFSLNNSIDNSIQACMGNFPVVSRLHWTFYFKYCCYNYIT